MVNLAGFKLHPSLQQTALEFQRHGIGGVTKARGNLGLDRVPTPHLPPQVHAWDYDTQSGTKAQVSVCRIFRGRQYPFRQSIHCS